MTFSPRTALAKAAALVALLWTATPSANACTCLFPHDWGFVGAKDGRLPANAAGVAWYAPERQDPKELEGRLSVEILEGGEFRDLPTRVSVIEEFSTKRSGMYLVAPKGEELTPGATYRFTVDRADRFGRGHRQVLVSIDHDSLSSDTSFSLDVGPVTNEIIELAAAMWCSDVLSVVQTGISGNLAQDAQRWRASLLYRTIVNEEIHWRPRAGMCQTVVPGRSWESVGKDLVFAACEELPHTAFLPLILKPRQHSLMMQAVLPGTGIVLNTPVKNVDLHCPDGSALLRVDEAHRASRRPRPPPENGSNALFYKLLPGAAVQRPGSFEYHYP